MNNYLLLVPQNKNASSGNTTQADAHKSVGPSHLTPRKFHPSITRSADDGSLPPVLLRMQHTVTQEFISRVILYSLNGLQRIQEVFYCGDNLSGEGQVWATGEVHATLVSFVDNTVRNWQQKYSESISDLLILKNRTI